MVAARLRPMVVLTVFGTRPEAIKLAPILAELEGRPQQFRTINLCTSQHTDLLLPFLSFFSIRVDADLAVMTPDQPLNQLCARVIALLDPVLAERQPDVVLVQGDTTSAMAAALAARYRGIPVGHVEAGLRTGNLDSPFPEELNRRLITRLAEYHFAATAGNRATLLAEGVPDARIEVTGNPVVDAVRTALAGSCPSGATAQLLAGLEGQRVIVLTSHRRESFGAVMRGNLDVLRRFIDRHENMVLVYPVHPNPRVREAARDVLGGMSRIRLIEPLGYLDFLHLLARSWLIVSDSGGVQEEAPTLGKPLLILRENTERPEAVACGVARLVGGRPERLAAMLDELAEDDGWVRRVGRIDNPFGRGDSARRIADALLRFHSAASATAESAS